VVFKKKIKKFILHLIFNFQKLILFLSFFFYSIKKKIFYQKKKEISWVLGVVENAAVLKHLSLSIPNCYSVCLKKDSFYEDFNYDYFLTKNNSYLSDLKILFFGPILLGRLINEAQGFFYIWSTRFLINHIDEGFFEYKFLKKRKKKIVLFFIGSDIRSPSNAIKMAQERGDEVTANFFYLANPNLLSLDHEIKIKKRVLAAEKFSDQIYTSRIDQISYFKRETLPAIKSYPDQLFVKNLEKFDGLKITKIFHAPSSPIIKGTQLIRAAITRLKKENYKFEYKEANFLKNSLILEELKSTHIVLDQFYSHDLGIFSVEAMANCCVLMNSADENIETDLPKGSNDAWVVTKNYEIYDKLKFLLDNAHVQAEYAEKGYNWALQHTSQSAASKKLKTLLGSINI
jgi:hypothetical protein